MKILVADDDSVSRKVLSAQLRKLGAEVIECSDGTQVMTKVLANDLPQVLFLDWMMPGFSGLDLCREIRARTELPYTHLVVVTSKSSREDIIEGIRVGANDYIIKPSSVSEIESRFQVAKKMVELNNLVSRQRDELVATSRLALLGQMASGLAHEINNPLAIVAGHIDFLEVELGNQHPDVADSCSVMQESVGRIAKVVRGMQDFAAENDGSQFTESSFAEISQIVQMMCKERLRHENIELRENINGNRPIWIQKMRIAQVLLALVESSRRLLEGRANPWILIESYQDGDHLVFAVSSNGCPIPNEMKPTLLLPFMDRTGHSLSAGIGLSSAKGIMEFHGGSLSVDQQSLNPRYVANLPLSRAKVA